MNGGTNIALAILTASEHMQSSLAVGAPRTMILLTDGRIDHHQGTQQFEMQSMAHGSTLGRHGNLVTAGG